jgi:hypothetical protein
LFARHESVEEGTMKRMFLALAAMAITWSAMPAFASFHLFRIDQVFSNADGTIQYVVMTEPSSDSNSEHFWAGQTLATSGAGGAKQIQFPSNLPSSVTAGKSVLIATSGFAALGLVTPDYMIPAQFIPVGGGTLNYANGTDQITLPPLPTDGATAIDRNGNPVPATPRNFAGVTAALTLPPPTAGAAPDLNQHGLTGSWYEPATSGQGIEIEVFPDLIAPGTALVQGAWFTFDGAPAGGADRERWYTFNGNGQGGSASAAVTIYRNTGGNFDAAPITQATVVGSGTLAFTDCSNGTLAYAFTDGSGRSGTIPLTRLTPNVTCAVGAVRATNADFGLSGNWFDAATSGQGFVFDVNPVSPAFFLTWYTYAPAGQAAGAAGQRWFVGLGTFQPGSRSIPVTLFETTGGLFDQVSNPAASSAPVGTATVTFANCASAQVQFNFTGGSGAGRQGTIALSRVGPIPQGCQNVAASAPSGTMMPVGPGMGYGYGPT